MGDLYYFIQVSLFFVMSEMDIIFSTIENFFKIEFKEEYKKECIQLIQSKFLNSINKEAYKFFLMVVEDYRVRTNFYNKTHRDLDKCLQLEKDMISYLNSKLQLMRDKGFTDVPKDIPARQLKYPIRLSEEDLNNLI